MSSSNQSAPDGLISSFESPMSNGPTQTQVSVGGVEPIRFPHIPGRNRSLPASGQYFLSTGHLMRRDQAHPPENLAPDELASAATGHTVSGQEDTTANSSESPTQSASGRNSHAVTTEQIAQIAEYLKRKRDELDAENSELAITSWHQHQWLLEQKESIRENQNSIRRMNALAEKMRCELIELGHCLAQNLSEHSETFQQFRHLCETYSQISEQAQKLKVG